MALVYTGPHDEPDSVLLSHTWAYGIDEEGPIGELFEKLSGLNVLSQPGLKGVTPWCDGVHMRVAVVEDGDFIWIAGRKGGFGHKDGPAADATFSIGWLGYTAYGACIDSHGNILISEGYNGLIRKISKPQAQTWHQAKAAASIMVSTVGPCGGIALAIDASDNIWIAPGEGITKIAPDGTRTNYGYKSDTDLLNGGNYAIDTLAFDGAGQIFARSNWNWASVFWRIDSSDGSLHRIAGMSEQMIQAYLVANGFPATGDDQYNNAAPTPIDGPNLTATFHTANLVGLAKGSDGKAIYLLTGNGDENMVRKIDLVIGRTSHLMQDGTWQELNYRFGGMVCVPNGFDPVTKTIFTFQQPWLYVPPYLWRRQWKYILEDIPTPTPIPGGHMQGFLDGIDANNNVFGWCVDGTAPVNVDVIIDGAVAATVTANVSRPDLVSAGVASDPNHGVSWPIADAYKDGKPHTAGIRYNGTMLPCSSGGGNTKSFTIAVPVPAPPPPPPVVAIPPGTYNFTGTLTSPDGTTNGTITASIVVTNPQPVPGTVTLTFTKL